MTLFFHSSKVIAGLFENRRVASSVNSGNPLLLDENNNVMFLFFHLVHSSTFLTLLIIGRLLLGFVLSGDILVGS